MPNKKIELILMLATKIFFFKSSTFFQKLALIPDSRWVNGCQKNKEGMCLSQSIKTKGLHSAVETSHTMKVWERIIEAS